MMWVRRQLAPQTMLEDWRAGGDLLGSNVRPYDPVPPAAQDVDLSAYTLKLATITKDNSKKGWERFKIAIPNEVRSRYMGDAVHAGQWRDLILDFDKKFLDNHVLPEFVCFWFAPEFYLT